ncbi:MAG: 1-acyl-sn-glycerol-3-phosphate acyltransferase [Clostridia bacterium]|nr:1-acyl-sn-glycerol-3-phosphate acyltransferase [Clostridia bacterium]
MSKAKKKTKWVTFRHRVIRNIAYVVLYPYFRMKCGIKIEKFKNQGKRRYLVLMNHQTGYDQFFVGMVLKGPVYYVASEDIFTNGWISRLLVWAVAPIPIKKQATDARAVLNCKRVAKEGGTIAIFPEGNRTYSGYTGYFNPAIVGLAKILRLPIAFLRLEGGYGVMPRWSDTVRKGKSRVYVSSVMEPEEYLDMDNDALYAYIQEQLYIDESETGGEYTGKALAEYLERAMYVCPTCGLSTFESHKDTISCKRCGLTAKYLPSKKLEGVGKEFPFNSVSSWYRYQCDFVNKLDLSTQNEAPMYEENVKIFSVVPHKTKTLLTEKGKIELYGNRIVFTIGEEKKVLDMDSISVAAVLGKNKLNLYHGDDVYQVKGDKRFNALKYVNICYRYKNLYSNEAENGQFLGL